jgi:predicted RND superfamily exporter protein
MEYQQKDAQLQQAGRDAMQDEEVHKAAEELSKATIVAMREQDPKTAELLQEMEQLREEMQQIVAKAKADADGK